MAPLKDLPPSNVVQAVARFFSRLWNAFSPGRAEDDLARETTAHLTLLEDDLRRRGMTADEARAAARRAFGGVEQMKDRQRDARSFAWLDDARWDLRHAARLLRRDPLFTLTAVLSLAIGIGANTTIFTIANALLFRPPSGVVEPSRLVDVGRSQNGQGFDNSSYPNFVDIRSRNTVFTDLYAVRFGSEPMSLARPTAPVWASTYHATVPSMIALPFERPMAIGRPVRGLRRARKSRGKFLTRGAPEDAHRACPVASICSMTRSTRAR